MNTFKIVPLSEAFATRIRESRKDDFGNEVIEQVAKGYGPCRVSLKPFVVNEEVRLLCSYSPFEQANAFNQSGPIFINREAVGAYKDVHRFPPEIKADKVNFPLTLIGYSKSQKMVHAQLVGDADVDELIVKIFNEHPYVSYLHARNAEAACFICKIERA